MSEADGDGVAGEHRAPYRAVGGHEAAGEHKAGRGYKAGREYKEVLAGITAAVDALRERDRVRAAGHARELVSLEDDMLRAGERAALTRLGVELHWEAALEALWMESWMKLRPRPDPDPRAESGAGSADLAALDAEVEQRSAELQDAVRRRRFGFPRR